MKYQVSLNGKQFEVEVEKGSVSAVPTGAAPASTPGCSSAGTRGSAGSGSSTRTRTRSSACRRRDPLQRPCRAPFWISDAWRVRPLKSGDVLFILEAMKDGE